MFSKLFGKKAPVNKPVAPEIMGLHIGGSFEIDALKLRLMQPELLIEGAAEQHLIQAVGEVELDTGSKILRYYTDDDGFLQVVLDGGDTENHISDVKLWYFYNTATVGSDQQWQGLLSNGISQPTYRVADTEFSRVWQAVGEASPPVAMTEKTYQQDGSSSETDQFVMLYQRDISDNTEFLMVSGEEKIIEHNCDRCLVLSTGFNIQHSDIKING